MAKGLRNEFNEETYKKLKEEIAQLEPPTRQRVIRAFSIYFHLINIAEQNHRIRRRRQYQLNEEGGSLFLLKMRSLRLKSTSFRMM